MRTAEVAPLAKGDLENCVVAAGSNVAYHEFRNCAYLLIKPFRRCLSYVVKSQGDERNKTYTEASGLSYALNCSLLLLLSADR